MERPDKVGAELKERAEKAQAMVAADEGDYADEAKRAQVKAR